ELEKIKRLYQFVTTRIESSGPDWANNTAEDTLLNGQGSRTATLVALAQASGLKADLLLARRVGQNCGKGDDFCCYKEPLVRFWLNNGLVLDVDAESEDLTMGAISPSIAFTDALLVPLSAEDQKKARIVALSTKAAMEKSIAEGDLTINDGNLSVNILVRLGPARAQEIRNLLRTAGGPERQAFFEQLAIRIFPGATAVTGTALHEKDPELPLELQLRYTVPQFITFTPKSGVVDIDQLAPALGLGSVYARAATRKFPLYIESLYFESTIFHLHLPDGMNVITMPADFSSKGEFGEYSVRFIRLARQIDIHREFHIPVQVIMPERYAGFSNFARQIDEAEQQRISLGATGSASGDFRKSLR
ncbi:MAG TPA: DUF3858 domain-containing protein, partial [Candidatus Angelobacter sp.]|nr:DUF3858 domain-containing protein [Candidatus Angelobacter sp.]